MPAISIIAVAEAYVSLVCSFRRRKMQTASLNMRERCSFEA